MILEVSWDGLWTLSFGLSLFHGHGSWLVCEAALSYTSILKKFIYVKPKLYFERIIEFLLNLVLKFQARSSMAPHTKYIEDHYSDILSKRDPTLI